MTESGQKFGQCNIFGPPMPWAAVHYGGHGSVVVDFYSLFVVALIICGGCV